MDLQSYSRCRHALLLQDAMGPHVPCAALASGHGDPMKRVSLAAFGWLVPGGAYLLTRRYLQFAVFAVLVCTAFAAGIAMQGAVRWPTPAELQGLDPFTSYLFQAGAFAKMLAGAPFLATALLGPERDFLTGRVHEYGSTLLLFAGLFNLLAISSALET